MTNRLPRGYGPQGPQQRGEHRLVQVDGDPLAQQQRGNTRVEPGADQSRADLVGAEVDGNETDPAGGQAETVETRPLVALGVGMVDLEPPHPRLGVTQGPAVVARGGHHHLGDPTVDRRGHLPVEERGAGGQIADHGPVRPHPHAGGDVGGQPVLGGRITVGGRHPVEAQPVGGHPLGGDRRLARLHGWTQTRAMFTKRVTWSRKASDVDPVGPLRCLATMISAVPFSADSRL